MANTPKIISNELDQVPKTGKLYKDALNNHNLRNQIIEAFDVFNKNIAKKIGDFNHEYDRGPEAFYKKYLSPEDYSVLYTLCTQKFNLYTNQFGTSKPRAMSFSWGKIRPIFNNELKIKGLNINFPDNNVYLSLSPVEEQIKLIELLNKLSIKTISEMVFGEKLLLDERFKDIHEINGDISIVGYNGLYNMFSDQNLDNSQKEQKIIDIIERLNNGDLRVTGNINIFDTTFSLMKKCKKITGNIYISTKRLYDMCEEITGDLHTARDIKYPGLKKIGGNLIFELFWGNSDAYNDNERMKEKSLSLFPNLEEIDGNLDANSNMIHNISDIDKLRYVGGDLNLGDISFESELRKRIKEGKLKVKGAIYMNGTGYKYLDGELKAPLY